MVWIEHGRLVRDARTGADERHVAAEHVDELRQLVEAVAPQPRSDPRDLVRTRELVEARRRWGCAGVHDRLDVRTMRGLVGIDHHRPELEERERLHVLAEPLLTEEHRTRRVAADAPREPEKQRREGCEQERGADDVAGALHRMCGARGVDGRERQQLEALDVVDRDHGPYRLEEAGDEVDLNVQVAQPMDEPELELVTVVRERDHDPLDVVLAHELGDLVRGAEDGNAVEVGAHALRVGIDEADEPDAELGVLPQLASDELTDVARPDDQRVLHVPGAAPRERACGGPRQGDRDTGGRPEGDEAAHRPVEVEEPGDDDAEPGTEADDEDERPDLVERRVIELVITVVEAEDVCRQDPQRSRQREEHRTAPQPVRHLARGGHDRERDEKTRDVSGNEPPPDHRHPVRRTPGCGLDREAVHESHAVPRVGRHVLRRAHRLTLEIPRLLSFPNLSRWTAHVFPALFGNDVPNPPICPFPCAPTVRRKGCTGNGRKSRSRARPSLVGEGVPVAYAEVPGAGTGTTGPARLPAASSRSASAGLRRSRERWSATSTAFVCMSRSRPISRALRSAPYRNAIRSRSRSSSASIARATVSRRTASASRLPCAASSSSSGAVDIRSRRWSLTHVRAIPITQLSGSPFLASYESDSEGPVRSSCSSRPRRRGRGRFGRRHTSRPVESALPGGRGDRAWVALYSWNLSCLPRATTWSQTRLRPVRSRCSADRGGGRAQAPGAAPPRRSRSRGRATRASRSRPSRSSVAEAGRGGDPVAGGQLRLAARDPRTTRPRHQLARTVGVRPCVVQIALLDGAEGLRKRAVPEAADDRREACRRNGGADSHA